VKRFETKSKQALGVFKKMTRYLLYNGSVSFLESKLKNEISLRRRSESNSMKYLAKIR